MRQRTPRSTSAPARRLPMHRPSRRPVAGRGALLIALWLAAAGWAGEASAWGIRDDATRAALGDFNRDFGSAAFAYPRHGAGALGWIGFEVWADVSGVEGFADDALGATAVEGELPGDFLAIARVGARKGLPGGIDLGISYGEVLDADFDLLSAEVKYSLLEGGLLKPALAVRLSGTRSSGGDAYEFSQLGADVTFSKGFANLVPYVGVGLVHSESEIDRGLAGPLTVDSTDEVLFAGVTINLLLPRINVSVEQGEQLQLAVRFGIGL